jgi:DNA-directed RNA polymerase specialized sigma24 family protein
VYWRCVGRLAAIERFGTAPTDPPSQTDTVSSKAVDRATLKLGHLPSGQRAILALTMFGAHDLQQVSQTLRIPTAEVVRHLRETIAIGGDADTSGRQAAEPEAPIPAARRP